MSATLLRPAFSVPPAATSRPTFLMCSPEFFGVDDVRNPWMAGGLHRSSRDTAFAQWRALYDRLHRVADIKLLHPQPDCPDMVFVAHGAVVHEGLAAVASFSHAERRRETPHLRAWLEQHGYLLWETARETAFDGGGDAVVDTTRREIWAAHGSRTCHAAHRHIADAWHAPVHSLHLVDPRFFHLDTCFTILPGDLPSGLPSGLPGDTLLYYPGAFDAASLEKIAARWRASQRIEVSEADAVLLACSALVAGRTVFLGEGSAALTSALEDRGFAVERLALSEFQKSGGGVRSLALRLS